MYPVSLTKSVRTYILDEKSMLFAKLGRSTLIAVPRVCKVARRVLVRVRINFDPGTVHRAGKPKKN